MTSKEFYKKLLPVVDNWLDGFRKNGSLAIENAFDIAVVKEVLFRLDYDSDDQDDDVPLFDKVTPEFFLADILEMCGCWDQLGSIFICESGEAYETYLSIIRAVEEDWKAYGHEKDKKQV